MPFGYSVDPTTQVRIDNTCKKIGNGVKILLRIIQISRTLIRWKWGTDWMKIDNFLSLTKKQQR